MWAQLAAGLLTRPWVRRSVAVGIAALTLVLFMFNLRRAGERAGRASERLQALERTNARHHDMLIAASRRPRSRDALLERLRGGDF